MLLNFFILFLVLNVSKGLDTGISNEIFEDSCKSTSCKNDAVCVPLPNGDHFCRCLNGYGGKHCQVKNPCDSNSCQNGGKCRPTSKYEDKAYVCECKNEFYGELCEKKNDCKGNCKNGKCVEENGILTCSCLPGFTGIKCELKIDPCTTNPCKNDALCINEPNDRYSCICLPGYFGKHCVEKDPCSLNPCKNGGECRSFIAGSEVIHTCICKNYFYGTHCEKKNPCQEDPCKNNGLCKFEQDLEKFSCICYKGFTGEHCERKKNEICSSNSCLNGGTCFSEKFENRTYSKCLCPSSHYGLKCENQNPCLSSPCKNNGLCKFDVESRKISCFCMKNFLGKFCDEACKDESKKCKLFTSLNLCSLKGPQCKKSCGLCEN